MPDAPPVPAFRLGQPETTPRFAFSATLPADRLDEKYRPTTLSEVIGQGNAVHQLETFLEAPTSTAFLFEGGSGVGKTSAARALAHDLGVDPDWGFEMIESAKGDMEAVERALKMLRHVAPGSGFKMVLVDEADLMTPKASYLWLSALENLPPKSVVVFTTNRASHFPDRFLDRCERIHFECDGTTLKQDAQTLINAVWKREVGRDDAPSIDDLPNVVDSRGILSFRRAVMALNPLIRAKRSATCDGPSTVAFTPDMRSIGRKTSDRLNPVRSRLARPWGHRDRSSRLDLPGRLGNASWRIGRVDPGSRQPRPTARRRNGSGVRLLGCGRSDRQPESGTQASASRVQATRAGSNPRRER